MRYYFSPGLLSGTLAGFVSGTMFMYFLWFPELFEEPVWDVYTPTATVTLPQIAKVAYMAFFSGGLSGAFLGMLIGAIVSTMPEKQSLRFLPIFFTTVIGLIITTFATALLYDYVNDSDPPEIFSWLRVASGGIGCLIGWVFFRWYSKKRQTHQEREEKYLDVGLDE